MAGLDSIVQAGGRCNREGRLKKGRVRIFRAPSQPPPGTLKKALEVTEGMLAGGEVDLNSPNVFRRFFGELYNLEDLDAKNVEGLREKLNFATVARSMTIIEDGYTESIVVPYGEAGERIREIKERGYSRLRRRALQPFVVNVYPNMFKDLEGTGAISEVCEGLWALSEASGKYDKTYGLIMDRDPLLIA
jgi:CRISPR-associated endonuclease/helicase Cas3